MLSRLKIENGLIQGFSVLNFQKSMITDQDKIPKQPLFSKGCLTFKESGHTLIEDRGYYRCSEQVKGQCQHKGEKMIRVKDMVKRFGSLISKFELPEGEAIKVFDDLLFIMFKHWRTSSVRDMHLEEILTATGNIIIDHIKKGKEINRSDFLEFKRTYFQILKNQYEDILCNFLFDPLSTLNPWPKEHDEMSAFVKKSIGITPQRVRTNFAWHIQKIYLSNDGKITNIEFENWGWYLMQLTKKYIPSHMSEVKAGFVLNTKRFDTLDFQTVVGEYAINDFRDAYSYSAFSTNYAKEKILNKIFDGFEDLKSRAKIEYLKKLNGLSKQALYAYVALIYRI